MMLDIFSQNSPSANGAGLRPVLVKMQLYKKLHILNAVIFLN